MPPCNTRPPHHARSPEGPPPSPAPGGRGAPERCLSAASGTAAKEKSQPQPKLKGSPLKM